ncbi:MAG: hypothetical protein HXY34_12235 [Candidatus Thorarchaeota archaeon]|nr:hypothetical protein [Candidatus Thorarchaeota archaeon]
MRLTMSPAKMLVAKVVTHRDFEREAILAVEEFGLFEFIDVRHQAGFTEVKKTRDEETVYTALDRVSNLVTALGLDPSHGTGNRVIVDDRQLTSTLEMAAELLRSVEPEVLEIGKTLAAAQLELDRQRGAYHVASSVQPLGLDLGRIGTSEYTYTAAGVFMTDNLDRVEWGIREVTENAYILKSVKRDKATVVALSVPVDKKSAVDRVLAALGFEPFSVQPESAGPPEQIVQRVSQRISALEAEIAKLTARRQMIAREWGPRVLATLEALTIEKRRIDVKTNIVYSEQALKFWGWIPEGAEERLERLLRSRIGTALEVKFERPDFAEHDSPTHLDNPSIMKPTEAVIFAYGVPSKHDLDPTKIMWLTFPFIFGMIFADVGQGFLILLIGLAAWRAKRKGQNWGSMLGYLQTGAEGLVLMGLFSMLGGLLFGSFFGAETVIEPLWPIFAHTDESGQANPWRTAHMLKLSVEIGALQLLMGIGLNLYNKLKHRSYREALVSLSYMWVYLGFINLLFGVSLNNIGTWFSMEGSMHLWIPLAGIGYGTANNGVYPPLPVSPLVWTVATFIVPFVIMLMSSLKGGLDGVVQFLEYTIGMISHTVSYARIFALNTVHMILSAVFLSLPPLLVIEFSEFSLFGMDIIPAHVFHDGHEVVPYLPLLGAVLGTLVVGVLEGLLAFMHTLRLHFVEWFSKFYHGGGVPFTPFCVKRLHTEVGAKTLTVALSVGTNE